MKNMSKRIKNYLWGWLSLWWRASRSRWGCGCHTPSPRPTLGRIHGVGQVDVGRTLVDISARNHSIGNYNFFTWNHCVWSWRVKEKVGAGCARPHARGWGGCGADCGWHIETLWRMYWRHIWGWIERQSIRIDFRRLDLIQVFDLFCFTTFVRVVIIDISPFFFRFIRALSKLENAENHVSF